ncbi:hypothetical protein AVEN_170273-1 [Araneus ventricosus]|uniref:Protein DP71L n=1 Tax=Araneus ventricosus TaxID=182803 RepID=A0A4Y2H8L3_ARAVE|nr:hypothetical protein AVEN_170273-1 [Araneus ventricosus]
MSLNFIETLLDKLSPRDSGNSILKNWTGSQSLVGSNVSFNDSILYKYQETLLESNDSSSSNLFIKRSPLESTMFPFHHSVMPNSLVSRVSKIFFPTASSFQDYSRRIQDINTNHKISLNKVNYTGENLWEEFMQEAFNFAVNISKHHSSYNKHSPSNSAKQSVDTSVFSDTIAAICTSPSVNELPRMVVECLVESSPSPQIENHIKPEVTVKVLASSSMQEKSKKLSEPDMAVVTVSENSTVQKNKKITANNGTLNQELANRKTKEMQKRSRNRRRRQKRSNKSKNNEQKGSSSISHDQNLKSQGLCEVDSAVSQIGCGLMNNGRKCASENSATLCNVINITDNANSVQIILPDVSSFVITVDSAGDDSDWDENSDSEWLIDTSEFEFCGLNVANLPSSKPNTSLLSVPQCQDEDVEALQLNMLLHRVNKEWNEATKDLDGKSRSSTKVSFVPDDELVEILPVEVYERKGEWEMYALERLRFKRRIDELDKIISPCLTREHREKFLQKYHATDL